MAGWAVPQGLPAGRFIVPDPTMDEGGLVTEPVLWVSDDPVPAAGELWARLLARRKESRLWPLLLIGLYVPQRFAERPVSASWLRKNAGRPWHSGELVPVPIEGLADLDAEKILARWWREVVTGTEEDGFDFGEDALPEVPFRDWPGLAAPSAPGDDPDLFAAGLVSSPNAVSELTGREDPPYAGLVPAADGAAAIAACGWLSRAGDTAETAAVVRSWQQRFGARLCVLGFDTLAVAVAWPPQTPEHARRVAAEHLAFCKVLGTDFDAYADGLIGDHIWRFWWD